MDNHLANVIFRNPSGASLRCFVQSDMSASLAKELRELLVKGGGDIVNLLHSSLVILVEPDSPGAHALARDFGNDPQRAILSFQWVKDCVSQRRCIGPGEAWGGHKWPVTNVHDFFVAMGPSKTAATERDGQSATLTPNPAPPNYTIYPTQPLPYLPISTSSKPLSPELTPIPHIIGSKPNTTYHAAISLHAQSQGAREDPATSQTHSSGMSLATGTANVVATGDGPPEYPREPDVAGARWTIKDQKFILDYCKWAQRTRRDVDPTKLLQEIQTKMPWRTVPAIKTYMARNEDVFASCIIYNIPVRAYQPFETPDEESESSDDLTTLEEESLSDAPRPPPASLRKQTKKGVAWTQPDQDFTIAFVRWYATRYPGSSRPTLMQALQRRAPYRSIHSFSHFFWSRRAYVQKKLRGVDHPLYETSTELVVEESSDSDSEESDQLDGLSLRDAKEDSSDGEASTKKVRQDSAATLASGAQSLPRDESPPKPPKPGYPPFANGKTKFSAADDKYLDSRALLSAQNYSKWLFRKNPEASWGDVYRGLVATAPHHTFASWSWRRFNKDKVKKKHPKKGRSQETSEEEDEDSSDSQEDDFFDDDVAETGHLETQQEKQTITSANILKVSSFGKPHKSSNSEHAAPVPPRPRSKNAQGKWLFTEEDRLFLIDYHTWYLQHNPTASLKDIGNALETVAPHHTNNSWMKKWRELFPTQKSPEIQEVQLEDIESQDEEEEDVLDAQSFKESQVLGYQRWNPKRGAKSKPSSTSILPGSGPTRSRFSADDEAEMVNFLVEVPEIWKAKRPEPEWLNTDREVPTKFAEWERFTETHSHRSVNSWYFYHQRKALELESKAAEILRELHGDEQPSASSSSGRRDSRGIKRESEGAPSIREVKRHKGR